MKSKKRITGRVFTQTGRAPVLFAFILGIMWLLPVVAPEAIFTIQAATSPLTHIQTIGTSDSTHNVVGEEFYGDYFYVSVPPNIHYYKRNLQTGMMTYQGKVVINPNPFIFTFAGNRMYVMLTQVSGMTWFDIEDSTGKPIRRGTASSHPCYQIIAGPDGKDLYAKTSTMVSGNPLCLLHYQIDSTGKPVLKDSLTGKGLGYTSWGDLCPGIMTLTNDGKYLYTLSLGEMAVACIERQPNGVVTYKKGIQLLPYINTTARAGNHEWGTVSVTPDGKWLYVTAWTYGNANTNVLIIFKRDTATGNVTLQDTLYGDKSDFANANRGGTITFIPGTYSGLIGDSFSLYAFTFDSATGALSNRTWLLAAESRYPSLDMENGFFYTGFQSVDVYGVSSPTVNLSDRTASLGTPAAVSVQPNPFNPSTEIRFRMPATVTPAPFSLKVYNMQGQLIRSLAEGAAAKGSAENRVIWNAKDDNNRSVEAGAYFYRLTVNGKSIAGSMILAK